MKAKVFLWALVIGAGVAHAFTVAVDTYATNPGRWITVPVRLATSADLAYAAVDVTYDPQVLVCTKVAAGSLGGEFTGACNDAGQLSAKVFFASEQKGVTGALARITFAVRDGTAGQFSDVTVARVEAGDASGVRDIFVAHPVKTVNGMVRSVAADAGLSRLENEQVVVADTRLGSLSLSAGDRVQVSEDGTPVVVAGAISTAVAVPLVAPESGWQSGEYEVLRTPTKALSFTVDGTAAAVTESANVDGTVSYLLAQSSDGTPLAALDSGTNGLALATRNYVRREVAGLSGVKRIVVGGSEARIRLAHALGLTAKVSAVSAAGEVTVDYGQPELKIVAFDPQNGLVRAKVIPPEGQAIADDVAVGVIRLMGAKDLGAAMEMMGSVSVDASMYRAAGSEGEFTCVFAIGDKCFFRVEIGE